MSSILSPSFRDSQQIRATSDKATSKIRDFELGTLFPCPSRMTPREIIAEVFKSPYSPSTNGERLFMDPRDRVDRPELWALVKANQEAIMTELKNQALEYLESESGPEARE